MYKNANRKYHHAFNHNKTTNKINTSLNHTWKLRTVTRVNFKDIRLHINRRNRYHA